MALWETIYAHKPEVILSKEEADDLIQHTVRGEPFNGLKGVLTLMQQFELSNGICTILCDDREPGNAKLTNVFAYFNKTYDDICDCGNRLVFIYLPKGLIMGNPEQATFLPCDADVMNGISRDEQVVINKLTNTCAILIEREYDESGRVVGLSQDYEIYCPICFKWREYSHRLLTDEL